MNVFLEIMALLGIASVATAIGVVVVKAVAAYRTTGEAMRRTDEVMERLLVAEKRLRHLEERAFNSALRGDAGGTPKK